MLRTKKPQTSFNVSTLNSSLLSTQTTSETMEKEIDNYTRRLQQDKRKFFRAQENYSQIKKEYDNKNKELQKLKSKQHKTETMALKGKIGTLEATLDQTINSYNESLSKNNKLRCEIDELRKEKKTENQKVNFLGQRLEDITQEINRKQNEIQQRKSAIQTNKQSIIRSKQFNDSSVKHHQVQVHMIKSSFQQAGRQQDRRQKQDKCQKTQNIDTQPVLKLRLKNLISKNKEKMRIIEQYKKSMHLIFENFEEIKEESGVEDLEEITKTFLKQEEQNLFIYQYMSRLNGAIQTLKDSNQEIRNNIHEQLEVNKERRNLLAGTPEQERKKKHLQQFTEQKQRNVNNLKEILYQIKPKLLQVLHEYHLVQNYSQFQLNQNNVQTYISQLEDLINQSKHSFETLYKGEFKEDVTRYTKLPPAITDQLKEKTEEKLLEKEKLKEIAGDFWEKKRAAKIASNKPFQSIQ